MTASNWPAAIALVLRDEGGYAERALESGGAVNRGVTFTVFHDWRMARGHNAPTFADLKAMSVAETQDIYRAKFAAPIRFDDLPAGVDYLLLDSAVNNGAGGMFRMLAHALGAPRITNGRMDDITLSDIAQRGPESTINAFCDERMHEQRSFRNYAAPVKRLLPIVTFGMVWDRRVTAVRKRALAMVEGAR